MKVLVPVKRVADYKIKHCRHIFDNLVERRKFLVGE